ncbi:MAG: DNA mismatch repair protein MutS [Hyphomicrobiaceae bacterium]
MARPKLQDQPPDLDDASDDAAPEILRAPEPPAAPDTPMMLQYTEIKAANPDCLLFYRMGDFYELFFEDAVVAAEALGIALTKRGKHRGEDIPMCGVPIHAADEYLQRLIKRGFRVAVCEQMEDPAEAKKRGSKAVVRRDVIRLVTPGTLTEDTLLDAKRNNYLSALFEAPPGREEDGAEIAIASIDISTGEFLVSELARTDLVGEVARLVPSELLVPDGTDLAQRLKDVTGITGTVVMPVAKATFDARAGERDLKARLGVQDLGGFGGFSRLELSAIGAVLKYIELTQIGRQPVLRRPLRTGPRSIMVIDQATRTNLELLRSTSGERAGSLIAAMDRTVTGPGARELAARLASPLKDVHRIAARLDAVAAFAENELLRGDLRRELRQVPDMARALSRLAFGRGGPRDLGALRNGLASARACRDLLNRAAGNLGLPEDLKDIVERLGDAVLALADDLAAALVEELPQLRRDGGFVREGYRAELDENRRLRDESRKVIAELQTKYQTETQIKSLKVRHNNVLGYFIEVTAANAKALQAPPLSERFHHRQTMASAMRFTTPELSEAEGRISAAATRALAIEDEIFAELAAKVLREDSGVSAVAAALAELDHTQGLAELAVAERYVRPVLDTSPAFEISGGRHPVVEQALKRDKQAAFIENDCVLGVSRAALAATKSGHGTYRQDQDSTGGFEERSDARIWLVTGPNMAGKSTYLRQNAMIAIMAQMGSFVPARSAHIGIVDRLFSRVGAADDLARGRSTFMVEMVETAGILNQAGERSLVILDEIGRGTATFDGLSIAWATVEYLHDVCKCRALFATHYHELTALAQRLMGVANRTMQVKEWKDDIVFLHKVVPGAADRSYGIQVAKLAGLPSAVIGRASEVLKLLEDADQKTTPEKLIEELPLFAAARPKSHVAKAGPSPIEQALTGLNPDAMSPREALDALYKLKTLAGSADDRG